MRPAVALALVLVPGPLLAQPREDEGRLVEARLHMEEGQTLYVRGRYVESAQEFLRAYEARNHPAFLFNAAVAYERFGHLGLAAGHFERYLAEDPTASDREEVAARIVRLRAAAGVDTGTGTGTGTGIDTGTGTGTGTGTPDGGTPGGPEAPPPTAEQTAEIKSLLSVQTNPAGCQVVVRRADGTVVAEGTSPLHSTVDAGEYTVSARHPDFRPAATDPLPIQPGKVYVVRVEMAQGAFLAYLRVVANVSGAEVFVDEREVGAAGETPFTNPYPVGRHRVWVEKPGYRPIEAEVDLSLGEDVTLRVELVRVDYGYLDLRSNVRGAEVFVDERPVGAAPVDHQLGAGRHVVRVEADGYKTFEGRVRIAKGQRTRVDVRMRPSPGRTSAWVATCFTVVAFGAAGYFGLRSSSLYDDLEQERDEGRLVSNDPRITDGFLYSLAADIGFVVGTVVGGFALYYWLRDPLPDSSAAARRPVDLSIRPLAGPELAGLALGGSL